MKNSVYIFDMDGTLIDSLIFWNLHWEEIGRRYLGIEGFRPTEADDKAIRTLVMQDAMTLIHRNYGIASSAQELIDHTNRQIKAFYETVQLKDGVLEFLEHCKHNGIRMCIASASEKDFVKLVVKGCGLDQYFDNVFSCCDIGKGKDHPDIYLQVQEYYGTETENTWVFEDSATAIETAVKLGMPTVAIYDDNNFGQERMREIATHYIAKGETLMKLV